MTVTASADPGPSGGEIQVADLTVKATNPGSITKINNNWFYNPSGVFMNTGREGVSSELITNFTDNTGGWSMLVAGNDLLGIHFPPDISQDTSGLHLLSEYYGWNGMACPSGTESDWSANGQKGNKFTQGISFNYPLGTYGRGWSTRTQFYIKPNPAVGNTFSIYDQSLAEVRDVSNLDSSGHPMHNPVLAIWGYGTMHPNIKKSLCHVHGGGVEMNPEVDMEMGPRGSGSDASGLDYIRSTQVIYQMVPLGSGSKMAPYANVDTKLPFNIFNGNTYEAELKLTPQYKDYCKQIDGSGSKWTLPWMKFQWFLTNITDGSDKIEIGPMNDLSGTYQPGGAIYPTDGLGISSIIRPFNGIVNHVISTELMYRGDATGDLPPGSTVVTLLSNTVENIGHRLDASFSISDASDIDLFGGLYDNLDPTTSTGLKQYLEMTELQDVDYGVRVLNGWQSQPFRNGPFF